MTDGATPPAPEERERPDGRRTEHGVRMDANGTPDGPRRAVLGTTVHHEPGVLAAVSGMFARRQFNIKSLSVGPALDDDYARMTIVVEEPEAGVEQVKRQLAKRTDVVSVFELGGSVVERELALLAVDADRPEAVRSTADLHDARVVDAGPERVTVEVTGSEDEVDAAIAAFDAFGLHKVVRTGPTALTDGEDSAMADGTPGGGGTA